MIVRKSDTGTLIKDNFHKPTFDVFALEQALYAFSLIKFEPKNIYLFR
jgi:hypothetical protein